MRSATFNHQPIIDNIGSGCQQTANLAITQTVNLRILSKRKKKKLQEQGACALRFFYGIFRMSWVWLLYHNLGSYLICHPLPLLPNNTYYGQHLCKQKKLQVFCYFFNIEQKSSVKFHMKSIFNKTERINRTDRRYNALSYYVPWRFRHWQLASLFLYKENAYFIHMVDSRGEAIYRYI